MFDDMRGHSIPGFDEPWRQALLSAWRAATATPIVDGGVYVQMNGPRFETPAEIRFLATIGDVVGMTIAAECIVAKEVGAGVRDRVHRRQHGKWARRRRPDEGRVRSRGRAEPHTTGR